MEDSIMENGISINSFHNNNNNNSFNRYNNSDTSAMYLDDLLHNMEHIASTYGKRSSSPFEFMVEGVLLTTVSIFGLVGNAVAIAVLSRPCMKGSFSTLLIGLSSFDTLYLVIGIAIFGLPALSPEYLHTIYATIIPVCFGLGHIGRVGSVFVTLSVTIERYFAIVHPLKHFWQKKFLLLGSTVAAVIFNVPKFFELESMDLEEGNMTMVAETSLRSNPVYVTYYIFWSKFILVEIIPYFTIIILNSLIISKIWKSVQFRKRFVESDPDPEATTRQRREANLGLVLISISFLFVLCQSVKIIPDFYEAIFCRFGRNNNNNSDDNNNNNNSDDNYEDDCETTPFMENLINISHLMLAINSSANFILYTWRGEKFRETLTTAVWRSSKTRSSLVRSGRQLDETELGGPAATANSVTLLATPGATTTKTTTTTTTTLTTSKPIFGRYLSSSPVATRSTRPKVARTNSGSIGEQQHGGSLLRLQQQKKKGSYVSVKGVAAVSV